MLMIKKYCAYSLLFLSVLFFIYQKVIKENQSLQVKAFNTNNKGWGYDIFKDNKLYIHQEIIPAIEGRKGFASKDEAQRVGGVSS